MATNVTNFRARFPEFSDDTEYTDARVQLFLDDAVVYIGTDESRWCGKYDLAQSYLAAHLLTSGTNSEAGNSNSSAGTITGKSAGGVSVTRGYQPTNRSDADNFYLSTIYGQQFLILRNGCFVGVLVANQL